MVAFAWCALAVFTVAVIALVVLLARALFRAIDRVDRIESGVGEGDARLGELRADLRSTMRRDMREILETGRSSPSP